jgi:hypothetical protein
MSDTQTATPLPPGTPRSPGNDASPKATANDPIKELVKQMKGAADKLGPEEKALQEFVNRLVEQASEPHRMQQPGFRTGVAYALQDLQKATGANLEAVGPLGKEMRERAVTSPGLTNPRMLELMQETPSMPDRAAVRSIRQTAAFVARRGENQNSAEAGAEIHALENRLRLLPSAGVSGLTGASDAPAQRRPEAPTGSAPPVSTGEAKTAQPSQQATGIPPHAARKDAIFNIVRNARLPVPSGAEMRRPPPAYAVGERISMFERRLAQGKTDRLVEDAERSGVQAMEAAAQFITGPGRGVLGKMEAAASTEPGGMQTVMREMQPGGRYANLRTEFDNAYQQDKVFAGAYDKMIAGVTQFGKDRAAVESNFATRGLDPSQLDGRFQRAEEALGEAASKVPGRTPGKSALDELTETLAEVLRKAVDAVKSVFGRTVNVETTQQSTPSPSPSM